MRQVVLAACLVVAFVSGCTDAPGPTATNPDPAPNGGAPQDVSPALAGVHKFHWDVQQEGDAVLQFDFQFPEAGTQCTLDSDASTKPGANSLMMVERGTEVGSWALGTSKFIGTFEGRERVTLLLAGLHPTTDSPEATAWLDLKCADAFDVLGAATGHAFMVVDGDDLAQARAAWLASYTDAAQVSMEFRSPSVRAGYLSTGDQSGTLSLQQPAGVQEWELAPWSQGFTDGLPGKYTFTLDRISVQYGDLQLVAFGIDGPLALS